jgi:hypothetical protein
VIRCHTPLPFLPCLYIDVHEQNHELRFRSVQDPVVRERLQLELKESVEQRWEEFQKLAAGAGSGSKSSAGAGASADNDKEQSDAGAGKSKRKIKVVHV